MPRLFATLFVLISIAAPLVAHYDASGQEGYRLSIDQVVEGTDEEAITVYVSVLDPLGRPVPDLQGFSATVDDTAAEVTSVQPAVNGEVPIAALLAIDVSGSMAGAPIEQAKLAAATLVQDLFPEDSAALLTFASGVELANDYSTDKIAVTETISTLEVDESGGTALFDALAISVEGAQTAPLPRRAIILLTDGRESDASERTADEAIQTAASAGIPVFGVALGPSVDTSFLQAAATASGGALLLAPTSQDVPDVFAAIGEQLGGQYGLAVTVPEGLAGPASNLIVRIDVGGRILSATAPLQRPDPPSSDSGGGSVTAFAIVAVVVLAILALIAAAVWYRRRRLRPTFAVRPGAGSMPPAAPAAAVPPQTNGRVAPTGQLTVIAGPNAGATVTLSSQPIDIGAAPSCDLRLDAGDGTGLRHARVWLQNDRFVIHHLARGVTTYVADQPIEWATLEKDDTVRIGPHVLTVHISEEQTGKATK